jgi:diguanylate cyclase (GGDEF)-like protein
MSSDKRLKAPELLKPRLEVLTAGLKRIESGREEGEGTVRRMGRVFLNWAIGEGLEEVEQKAFGVVRADDDGLLEAGAALKESLEEVLTTLDLAGSERLLILAAEDSPEDGVLLELALAAPDRVFVMVPSGEEAEEILARQDVSLLVLDMHLPDTDGRTLIAQIRAQDRYKDLAILVVSGKGTPEVKAECLALGANGFFEKPVDPTAISAAASSILHKEASRRENQETDPLTGLLRRDAIRELWNRWTFPAPSSVGIVGIDRFDDMEERFDHEVADGVLRSFGALLREAIPKGCVGARWEEADFLILCPGMDRDGATNLIKAIVEKVRNVEQKDAEGETFRITASGGVVEVTYGSTFDDSVEDAYSLLEGAFELGGNTVAEVAADEDVVRILVAEDDPLSAGILLHRLEKEGFEVLHFPDGAQALEGALANQVSMAILDVKMPGMDGFELLERLRKIPAYYKLPIMMLTSMGREEDIARGFDLGADDYMVKPFSPAEVLARVRRLLSR